MTITPLQVSVIFSTCLVTGIVAQTNTYPFPSSGNVGIGTTTPGSRKLNVQSSDSSNDVGFEVGLNRTIGTNYGLRAMATGVGAVANQGIFTTASGATSNYGLRIYNIAATANNFALFSDSPAQSYFQGSVGIGTTQPARLLELVSDVGGLGFEAGSGSPNSGAIRFGDNTGWKFIIGRSRNSVGGGMNTGSSGALLTVQDNGNVGIGTTTPYSKLEIRGDLRIYGDGADILTSQLYIANNANNRAWNWQLTSGGDSAFWGYDGSSWTETIRIKPSGNVGIGTTNPTQKLSVAGTVRAKEVIVDTGWSDFVFDESYKLKALSETEAFIRAKRHLPGIPSASEVGENGISVGEMQAKLLAKIEELTLHAIEQEKRIAAQNARMDEQDHRIHSLVTENHQLRSTLNITPEP